ncbi:hypothetical protein BZA05DRAFT_152570 [Tricharina praecox]|uniref:uncharacterized protein n=1 Tax=Tricharina praecox TaxID=43433 RepID=UPI00222105BF|nr:uncharacterized protein BZA05DRAFT_152570 [Tricharina praecox]KAI5844869.1 hypothetical protein BZA05DRAFT_152570 [Tricharina praecox]
MIREQQLYNGPPAHCSAQAYILYRFAEAENCRQEGRNRRWHVHCSHRDRRRKMYRWAAHGLVMDCSCRRKRTDIRTASWILYVSTPYVIRVSTRIHSATTHSPVLDLTSRRHASSTLRIGMAFEPNFKLRRIYSDASKPSPLSLTSQAASCNALNGLCSSLEDLGGADAHIF